MKILNLMNFVRSLEPRDAAVEAKLLDTTRAQLEMSLRLGVPTTFLLQYDALCNEDFVKLFSDNRNENIELGFWYEVVEPLTSAIGIPYNSKMGYKWDWNISPGFAMSYPLKTRERLIDEAMRKFREVFGYYPRTVGSWVLDTYTVNYLEDNYSIDALMICRDQISTDAYTMVGGYSGGIYYPSRNNVFTPGSDRTRSKTPVFRLLGADPLYNYDGRKYCSEQYKPAYVYTLEPASVCGGDKNIVRQILGYFLENESLDTGYVQLGQENSFANFDLAKALEMQLKAASEINGVSYMTVSETGRYFKKTYERTPPSAVCALKSWDGTDAQAVQYSSEKYTAGLMRYKNRVFLRWLYLFDDSVEDLYLKGMADTFDSIHENMPIIDTSYQKGDTDGGYGLILDTGATEIDVERVTDESLAVNFGKGRAVFTPDYIELTGVTPVFDLNMSWTDIKIQGNSLEYLYKGHSYRLTVTEGTLGEENGTITIFGEKIILTPEK